jgi:REP element-mobilizing transposase RayT
MDFEIPWQDLENVLDGAEPFFAQVILTVTDRAPLLARPRLARLALNTIGACAADAPGALWGWVVLPDHVRLIVGPTDEDALEAFVDTLKTRTADRLLDAIRRADDDSLDAVLRYNPVRGGAIYQVWQPGSHRTIFRTEYRLSNALYHLRQAPVEAGWTESAEAWPYIRIGEP